jgi:hypothetical protein
MANVAQVTVTATTGPGNSVTSKVHTGIKSFAVDVANRMLYLYPDNPDLTGPMIQYALTGTVTFTATISSGAWTVAVSAS